MDSKQKILKKAVSKSRGKGGLDLSKIGVGMGRGQGLANRSPMGLEKGIGMKKPEIPTPTTPANKYKNLGK